MIRRIVCLCIAWLLPSDAMAQGGPLSPGDIVVTDAGAQAVIRVDPLTGTQTVVSQGGKLDYPLGIAVEANGDIVVASLNVGAVVRVDPATGAQTVVSQGGNLEGPEGIAVEANGDLVVADFLVQAVIRVDPLTGAQTVVSQDGNLVTPIGIAVDPNGDLVVTEFHGLGTNRGVIRVDPVTGAQMVVTEFFADVLRGIAVHPNGDLFVAAAYSDDGVPVETWTGSVIRVDPVTGARTGVSGGDHLEDPWGIAVVPFEPQCPAAPDPTCLEPPENPPSKGTLQLRAPGGDRRRSRLAFRLTGLDLDENYLGDPTANSDVALCVYDDGQLVHRFELQLEAPSNDSSREQLWRPIGKKTPRGFRYCDRSRRYFGIKKVVFRTNSRDSSRPPNGRLVFHAGGPRYVPPAPVVPGAGTRSDPGQQFNGPVVAQVHNSANDNCLSIALDATGHPGERNRAGNYRDRCDSRESRGLIPDCEAMP